MIAISGSGNSDNVLNAVNYAKSLGCMTISLSGFDGGSLAKISTYSYIVPSEDYSIIENVHLIILHMIAYSFI